MGSIPKGKRYRQETNVQEEATKIADKLHSLVQKEPEQKVMETLFGANEPLSQNRTEKSS
jgi:hypothetical protein